MMEAAAPMDGVEKADALPALRTVRAVLPHTALQLVVIRIGVGSPSSGLWSL